ncbi:MAG TPA: oxidoreductase, partial [Propionibacteriaceae bacterium]|nr:oxidoreductase [Propionibacteriaceae bacterium]
IDVEDLAAWIVHCALDRVQGTFNAAGPTTDLGSVLTLARSVASSAAVARPVPADVLDAAGVSAWMGTPSLPLWIDDESWRYFATLDTTAARREGLRTRPLEETLRAALAFEERRTVPRQTGLTDDEEERLRLLLG